MNINGLNLPAAFVTAVRLGTLRRTHGSWRLRHDVDAWGQPLETELGEVYEDEKRIFEETGRLTRDFPADEWNDPESDKPDVSEGEDGFIPPILDFSQVLCFGVSGDDVPFCFDFRSDAHSPEVIWWADAYWRRVAPDWASFAALFDLTQ